MKSTYIAWKSILKYGLVLSLLFTVIVLGSYLIEPLMWTSDFPEEVQKKIGEIPQEVIPLGLTVFFLIIGICIYFPVRMNNEIFSNHKDLKSYWNLLINGFLLLNFMNLWDVIVVDILIFDTFQPDFMMIKGAEEYIKEHVNAGFHFFAFLKGQPWLLGVAAIAAGISKLFKRKKKTN